MFHKTGTALAIASALTLGLLSSAQAATDEPAMELDAQTVLGDDSPKQVDDYRAAASRSATRLELAPRETPQSVSTMTRAQMDDFQLDSIKDVLKYSTGVAVEEVETDRTYFTARGFDVTNFQYDGIGVPFIYGGMDGDIDTALFERIEILRGANGLMSGIGNPSATVNFVRKRPTVTPQARIDLATGSWDKRRLDTDVSGALNADGSLRGRLVYAHEQKNSWLDRYGREKNVFLGVVEMDLDDATVLTLGHSMQKTDADSPMWGALPLNFSDGSPTDYARSTSTSADWAYWNNRELRTFAELSRQLGGDWQVKGVLTRVEHDNDGRLFYVYGTPDRDTGLGLFSYPSLYSAENLQHLADLYASGPFQLGGREHELVVGASASKSELQDISHYGRGIGTALPPLQDWSGDYPLPPFDASVAGSEFTDRQRSGYAAVRLNLLDDLKLIAGARVIDVDNRGTSYGKSKSTAYHGKTVPYAGLVYDLNADYALYASYTGIFNPQTQVDAGGDRLDALEGENYEIGLKGALFDDRLDVSLAMFETRQDNLPEQAGVSGGVAYYRALQGIESRGWEVDVSGELLPGLQVSGGYTFVDISDADGRHARPYAAKHMVRGMLAYRLPQLPQLKVGTSLSWQDEVRNGIAEQDAYALVNLMASYDIDPHWSLSANLNNLTDEKYLTSLYWSQSYYGAPRNASVAVSWKY